MQSWMIWVAAALAIIGIAGLVRWALRNSTEARPASELSPIDVAVVRRIGEKADAEMMWLAGLKVKE